MTKALCGLATVLIVSAGVAGCGKGDSGQTCTYNGKTYPNGVTWPANDGCNECWCLGEYAGCSGLVCDAGVLSGEAGVQSDWPCTYDGKSYPMGATFPSTDGCNTCECLWRWYHEVACTLNSCTGSPVVDASAGDATADACVYNGKTYPLDVHFSSADGCDECHCRIDGQVTCTFQHTNCL